MAAPSGTVWGSEVGSSTTHRMRLGLYVTVSMSGTTANVSCQVWIWTRAAVSDNSNTFYFGWDTTNATTNKGSVSISTSTTSSAWSTNNQKLIATYTAQFTGITSRVTKDVAAKLTGVDIVGSSQIATVNTSYTITPAGGVMYVNDEGTWRKGIVYVNVGGTWRLSSGVYVNKNGSWTVSQ